MPDLILISFLWFAWRLIKRDTARREGVSAAVWLPTLWVAILTSRPLSTWIGFGGGVDSLEGSPLDRLFYLACIVSAFIIVSRRGVSWPQVISRSWPIFLFYAYFLISVLWAEPSSLVSLKRWYKDFGNIAVALVILTEANPGQAFRAVFVRVGYVWIPLSWIFLRWFPKLGRQYSVHGGMEVTGVTFQKNSLGAMVLVCGLVLIWDWFEQTREASVSRSRIDRYWPFVMLLFAGYLLYLCDSKTSIVCLVLGGVILGSSRLPLLRKRIGALGFYVLVAAFGFYILNDLFGVVGMVLHNLGRDDTLTGRTEVWRVLLALKTDPILGTGFCSFWSNRFYLSQLPYWIGSSAHNGYLEMYIDGGYIGIGFLALMLLGIGIKLNRRLADGSSYSLICFSVYLATVLGDFTESHYGRMSPLWFMFLLVALDPSPRGASLPEYQIAAAIPRFASEEPNRLDASSSRTLRR